MRFVDFQWVAPVHPWRRGVIIVTREQNEHVRGNTRLKDFHNLAGNNSTTDK